MLRDQRTDRYWQQYGAAGLPKHQRPNNAVELRVHTEKAIEVKKLVNVARETATVKGRLGKKQNEM
jgi:hypothetical protein